MKNNIILASLTVLMMGSALQAMNVLDEGLFDAAYAGKKEEVARLIADGANVNALGFAGETPLMMAAKYGHKEASKVLIDNGANVNIADNKQNTALRWAAYNGYKEIGELLINAMIKPTKEQIDSIVALLGSSKKKRSEQLNVTTHDVVKLIGREWYNALKRENKPKAKVEIERLINDSGIDPEATQELLDYLNNI